MIKRNNLKNINNLPEGLQISILDEIPWEPHVMGNSIRKILHEDISTGTYVHYRYSPPGGAEKVRQLHLTINETFFFISGDLPFYEYSCPEDIEGQLITFRSGFFMDRKPFSIHGRKPYPESKTGSTLLIWNSGGGEFEADTSESIKIPFKDNLPKFEKSFTKPLVINSENLLWENNPNGSGWKYKKLSTEENTKNLTPRPVSIIYIPPFWQNTRIDPLIFSKRPAWVFVFSGSITIEANGKKIDINAGTYLRWIPNIKLVLPLSTSPIGCTLLSVGHSLERESKSI